MNRSRNLFWKLTAPEHLRARAFCRRLAGNREDGDDLYQDALVNGLTRFESLRDTDAFRGWLYRIIVNNFKNRCRQPWWKKVGSMTSEVAESTVGEDPTANKVARRRLEIAFRAVSDEDRALVTLFELEGWSAGELAEMQSSTEGAIKMRLSRARKKMRLALSKQLTPAKVSTKPQLKKDELCVAAKPSTD